MQKRTKQIGITFSMFMILSIFAGLQYHYDTDSFSMWTIGTMTGLLFGCSWVWLMFNVDLE